MTLEELKKLCDEATPGPWEQGPIRLIYSRDPVGMSSGEWIAEVADNHDASFIAVARSMLPKLIAVAQAARSVLSEDGVKEHLCAYVMGVELIDRLAALEAN